MVGNAFRHVDPMSGIAEDLVEENFCAAGEVLEKTDAGRTLSL